MNFNQRINRLEQSQPKTSKQGLFSDNAELLVSIIDEQGKELYTKIITFIKPYGSTERILTPNKRT